MNEWMHKLFLWINWWMNEWIDEWMDELANDGYWQKNGALCKHGWITELHKWTFRQGCGSGYKKKYSDPKYILTARRTPIQIFPVFFTWSHST